MLRLLSPDGAITRLTDYTVVDQALIVHLPPRDLNGTNILSWRVASADGHPVAGSLTFSVDKTSGQAVETDETTQPNRQLPLWTARLLMVSCLALAAGSAFFRWWIFPVKGTGFYRAIIGGGCVGLAAALVLSLFQVLDAVGGDVSSVEWRDISAAMAAGRFGLSILFAASSIILAVAAMHVLLMRTGKIISLTALVFGALAFAVSGHASSAEPRLLMQPAVFIHALGILFWLGSLPPLLALMAGNATVLTETPVLKSFSVPILVALAGLLATGVLLAAIQLGAIGELWSSAYGLVLSVKLAILLPMLGLAVINRYVLTPQLLTGRPDAAAWFRRSLTAEMMLGAAILAVVGVWRFTPPPRAMSTVTVLKTGIQFHAHGVKAMANVLITPLRPGPAQVRVEVMRADLTPLRVEEVDVALLDETGSGLEPIRREAHAVTKTTWQVDDLIIPSPGHWALRLGLRLSDFDKVYIRSIINVGAP
jgi:copper transport protein